MLRSFCLDPTPISRGTRAARTRLQPLFHKLYDGVARDVDFLQAALEPLSRRCVWCAHEAEALGRLGPRALAKPRLLLPNSVYLQPEGDETSAGVLTVGNVQAGEPYTLELVLGQQRSSEACEARAVAPEAGPLHEVCAALAAAARLVHPSDPCVAILAGKAGQPRDALALRTRLDIRGVGETLLRHHGVSAVLYPTIDDLAAATLERGSRDLLLGDRRVSCVYSRYDFSHPYGRLLTPRDAQAGATTPLGDALRREWRAIDAMESSSAVLSSDLGSRLAHRRAAQLALCRDGGVERFLDADEAAAMRAALPKQWALGGGGGGSEAAEAAEARQLFALNPDGYVAKPVLRPRTGSDATQNRLASGGTPVTAAAALRALLDPPASGGAEGAGGERAAADGPSVDATHYVMYPKVDASVHEARIVHASRVVTLRAVAEVCAFGAYLTAPPADGGGGGGGGGEVLINAVAGFGARTRPADATHNLAAELGYGALSGCAVYE